MITRRCYGLVRTLKLQEKRAGFQGDSGRKRLRKKARDNTNHKQLTALDIDAARAVGVKSKMASFRTENKNAYLTKLHKHLETLPSADLYWLNRQVKDVGIPKATRAVKHTALIKKEKAARLAKG